MNSHKRLKPLCPTDYQLELLAQDSYPIENEKKRTQIHLQQCRECRERFEQFDGFYSMFLYEILKPVSNSALDFAKKIGRDDVVYGLFACDLLLDQSNGRRGFAYHTSLIFSANGELLPEQISNFRADPRLFHKLLLRVMTDPSAGKIMVFLKSDDFYTFKSYVLSIPGIVESAQLSPTGSTRFDLSDLKKLHNRTIYLQKIDENSALNEKRLDKIKNSIVF